MRLLSVIRLSDLTDETTSPERQRTKNAQYATLHDHEITREAEDLDVSGIVSPFKRKGLGPYLNDPALIGDWDAVIVTRIDRLTRSLFDFLELWKWMQEHGKSLICIDPPLDMTTATGRAFAQVLMTFAEFERETIAARVKDAYDKLRAAGQYTGGQVPFGYMPVKLDGKGWGFEPDPEYGPVVAEMVRRYLAFQSLNVIARSLNDSGVPTSRDVVRLRNGKITLDDITAARGALRKWERTPRGRRGRSRRFRSGSRRRCGRSSHRPRSLGPWSTPAVGPFVTLMGQ